LGSQQFRRRKFTRLGKEIKENPLTPLSLSKCAHIEAEQRRKAYSSYHPKTFGIVP